MSRRFLWIFALVFAVQPLAAQPQHQDARLKYGDRVYAEAVTGLSDSAGFARVDLLLRIAYDFMVFERNGTATPDSAFRGGVEVSVNLQKDGVSVGSFSFGARTATAAYTDTDRRDQFLLLQRTMYLEDGTYTALIIVSDRGSTREQSITQTFKAQRFDSVRIGTPVILTAGAAEGAMQVFGYSGFLPFAARSVLAIPTEANRQAEWHVVLERLNRGKEIVFEGKLQPSAAVQNVSLARASGDVERLEFLPCDACVGQYVLLELPLDSVDTGPYKLIVAALQNGSGDTVTVDTEIFWRDMPYSMRDIEFAVEAMKYILTNEEFEAMKDGDVNYMRQQFRRYWEERDPTSGTAFNELMAEYFKRADQAFYKFQTLFEPNGITTDRGKVYILFGPPEDTQRILSSDEPAMEVWQYPSLSKTFRFIDPERNGNFRLMED